MAGSSFLSFVEGDVGGKGRRCATAPAHPHPGANSLALISTPPFYGYKVTAGARGSKDGVCEVYTVYMGLCMYRYTLSTYIYRGEREREREREREQKTFPTSSNHRHSTAQPIDKKKKQALDVVSFRLLKVKYENCCREN